MVGGEELQDDLEFQDIKEDVQQECSQYGNVLSVLIPRGKDGFVNVTEGSIYVMFSDVSMAVKAAGALYGRKFAERVVIVEFVSFVCVGRVFINFYFLCICG